MPKRWATCSRSSSVVTGVILSTIEFGNDTLAATQSPRSGSWRWAYAVKTSEATWPFPWMLPGHDREGLDVPSSPSRQRLGDQAKDGAGNRTRREISLYGSVVGVELPGHRVEVVSALGHGQGHDPRGAISHLLDHRVRIVGGVSIGHDGSDHFWGPISLRILLHERVEAVLGHQGIANLEVEGHHTNAADSPVECFPLLHQRIEVPGLMGTIEPADTEVDDADAHLRTVVTRAWDRQRGHRGVVELRHDTGLISKSRANTITAEWYRSLVP